MRWLVFGLFVYVAMALDLGLRTLLEIKSICPSFLLIVGVFVAVSAPPKAVAWSCLVLGLLTDLCYPLAFNFPGRVQLVGPESDVAIIGPACIGYLLGGYVTLQLRAMMFRESPLTMGLTVIAMGGFVHLCTVAALTIRGLEFMPGDSVVGWHAADQLLNRFFIVIYTAVVALPVGYVLLRTDPLWGFQQAMSYRRIRRK